MTSCKTSEQTTTKKTATKYSVETDESGEYVSLLTDKSFKRGFKVWGLGLPIYGDDIELYGGEYEKETNVVFDYDIDQTKAPIWKLQQWATRYPFHDKANTADSFDYRFTSEGNSKYLYGRTSFRTLRTKSQRLRLRFRTSLTSLQTPLSHSVQV